MFEPAARRALLETARRSLEQSVLLRAVAPFPAAVYPPATTVWRSSFVTLMVGNRLRGCCGRLEAERPLIEDVWHNAYAAGFTGKGTTVAVLDTGVDQTHPDLADREIGERNFTSSPDAGDHYGHGTHVASIIAGTGAKSNSGRPGSGPVIAVHAPMDNGTTSVRAPPPMPCRCGRTSSRQAGRAGGSAQRSRSRGRTMRHSMRLPKLQRPV